MRPLGIIVVGMSDSLAGSISGKRQQRAMDKDLPGTSGELPPLQLTFIKKVETAETSPAGMRAGEA